MKKGRKKQAVRSFIYCKRIYIVCLVDESDDEKDQESDDANECKIISEDENLRMLMNVRLM